MEDLQKIEYLLYNLYCTLDDLNKEIEALSKGRQWIGELDEKIGSLKHEKKQTALGIFNLLTRLLEAYQTEQNKARKAYINHILSFI